MQRHNRKFNGLIRLYIGSMFSGKSSALIEAYTRHNIAKRKCLLIKHINDTRYDAKKIVSHDGKSVPSISLNLLCDVDHLVKGYNVICIDEVQFFEDAPIFCDKWANEGLIVEASGLSGTYMRTEFPIISKLIPLAEEIHKKSAICCETGNDANFTHRKTSESDTIVIGGIDKYNPVDRYTYFNNTDTYIKHDLESFQSFVDIYCHKNNLPIDTNELVKFFLDERKTSNCYLDILTNFLSRYKK